MILKLGFAADVVLTVRKKTARIQAKMAFVCFIGIVFEWNEHVNKLAVFQAIKGNSYCLLQIFLLLLFLRFQHPFHSTLFLPQQNPPIPEKRLPTVKIAILF